MTEQRKEVSPVSPSPNSIGWSGLLEKNLIMFDNDELFRRNKSSKGEIS
jgi:hypothetical protein